MIKHLSIVLLLVLSLSFTGVSCAGRMNVSEKMMWSTYPLATLKGAATGFVINHREPGSPGGKVPVVFTSVHVLETMGKGPLLIGFRIPDAAGEARVALLAFIPPKPAGKKKFYVRHPDFDIAAFALHIPPEVAARADVPSCLNEKSLSRDGKALHAGDEVSFLGYPDVFPGTDGAFPLLRSGRVASYPLGTSQAHGRFLVNSDVYPGDSGAPVFVSSTGTRPELVGMITQRISAKASDFSHFAIAVDADVIRETLALVEAGENRLAPAVPVPSPKPAH